MKAINFLIDAIAVQLKGAYLLIWRGFSKSVQLTKKILL